VPAVAPFDPLTRPISFTAGPTGWGPSHNGPCPCGSGLAAGECHVSRSTRRWRLPTYTPLLNDEPTGYAHPRCYAGFTQDCSGKITGEHWLSGLPWLTEESEECSIKSLAANILCGRHNSALSRLDKTATRVQTTLERYQLSQLQQLDPHGNEFDLYSGEELERWLLKLIWGATAAAKSVPDNLQATRLRNQLAQ
jgi:hypothetical protein